MRIDPMKSKPTRAQLRDRFYSRVERSDGCWIWRGTRHSRGYGVFYFEGTYITAHRAAFILENENIPIDGLDICHTCDNRRCVRPDHLFAGTRQDNMDDMVSKGRNHAGEKNCSAKIKNDQVAAIKSDTRPQSVIAAEYGVAQSSISRIKKGKTFATR